MADKQSTISLLQHIMPACAERLSGLYERALELEIEFFDAYNPALEH